MNLAKVRAVPVREPSEAEGEPEWKPRLFDVQVSSDGGYTWAVLPTRASGFIVRSPEQGDARVQVEMTHMPRDGSLVDLGALDL